MWNFFLKIGSPTTFFFVFFFFFWKAKYILYYLIEFNFLRQNSWCPDTPHNIVFFLFASLLGFPELHFPFLPIHAFCFGFPLSISPNPTESCDAVWLFRFSSRFSHQCILHLPCGFGSDFFFWIRIFLPLSLLVVSCLGRSSNLVELECLIWGIFVLKMKINE